MSKLRINTILLADAYKYTHYLQFPKNTTNMAAYTESRGSDYDFIDYTRPFGLQGFIKDYLEGVVIEEWMIDEAVELLGEVFGTHEYFNEQGFRNLLDKYKGRLPISIKSVKEGIRLPLKNVQVWTESTDPEFAWLVPWIETMLLRATWYPQTVCTISSAIKDIERNFSHICGCPTNPFFLIDFGARGVSSHESAELGGAAHLVNYLGSDTVEGVRWAKHNYGKSATGYSVFATEHSSTTIYLREGEEEAYKRFLTVVPKDKIVSIVSDSYDIEYAIKHIFGIKLRDIILSRDAPTVIRPDSGDPVETSLNILNWLWDIFGGTINDKGFKVINPNIRVLWGDGVNILSISKILNNIVKHGFSIENIFFGMGGKLLQGVNRDTFRFASKLCWAVVDGEERDVYKDPVGDTSKKSKKGRLKLIIKDGAYQTVREHEHPDCENQLIPFFLNGDVLVNQTFQEVRDNAAHLS
jgi:nicotinamide phosphoribosyltransferase